MTKNSENYENYGDSPKELRQKGRYERRQERASRRNDRKETRRDAPDARKTERKVDRWDGSAESKEREAIFNEGARLKREIQARLLQVKTEDYPIYKQRTEHVTGSAGANKYIFDGKDWGTYYKVIESGEGSWEGGDAILLELFQQYENTYKTFKNASIDWDDRDGLRRFDNHVNRKRAKEENTWELFEKWVNRFLVVQDYRGGKEDGSRAVSYDEIFADNEGYSTGEKRDVLREEISKPNSEMDVWADRLITNGYTAYDVGQGVQGAVACCPNTSKREALLAGLRNGDQSAHKTLANIATLLSERTRTLTDMKKAQEEFAQSTDLPEKLLNNLERAIGNLSDPQNLMMLGAAALGGLYLWKTKDDKVETAWDWIKNGTALASVGYAGFITAKRGIYEPYKEGKKQDGFETKELQRTLALLDATSGGNGKALMATLSIPSYKLAGVMEWGIRNNDTHTLERSLQSQLISSGADPSAIGTFSSVETWEGLTKIIEKIGEEAGLKPSQFASQQEYLLACNQEMKNYGSLRLAGLLTTLQAKSQNGPTAGPSKVNYAPAQLAEATPDAQALANSIASSFKKNASNADIEMISSSRVKINGSLFDAEKTGSEVALYPITEQGRGARLALGLNQSPQSKAQISILEKVAKENMLAKIGKHLSVDANNIVYRNGQYEMISAIQISDQDKNLAADLGVTNHEIRASFVQDNNSGALIIKTQDGASFAENELDGKNLSTKLIENQLMNAAKDLFVRQKPELSLGLDIELKSIVHNSDRAVLDLTIAGSPARLSFENAKLEAWAISTTPAIQAAVTSYSKQKATELDLSESKGSDEAIDKIRSDYEAAYSKGLLEHITQQKPFDSQALATRYQTEAKQAPAEPGIIDTASSKTSELLTSASDTVSEWWNEEGEESTASDSK